MRTLRLVSTLILTATLAGAGLAAQPEFGDSQRFGGHCRSLAVRGLDLSDEQKEQIEALRTAHQAEVGPLRESLGSLREELSASLQAEQPSAIEVGDLAIAIDAAKDQIRDSREAFRMGFAELLTDEQLARLERVRERCGQRFGRGPRGEGDRSMGRGRGDRGGRGPIPSRRFLDRVLDLSDEQSAQLDVLIEDNRAAVEPLREEIRALREELRTALDQEQPSAEEVGNLLIASHQAKQQIAAARESLTQAFEALLTPEQLEILEEFRERKEDRRGRRPGRGPGERTRFRG